MSDPFFDHPILNSPYEYPRRHWELDEAGQGTLFPWTMSDFSLMDAIECGIVKLPRVPVAENIPRDEMPMFRNLWENIRKDMPRKGRGQGEELDPLKLPTRLQTALQALYGHYEKTFKLWEDKGIKVPPCFIIVCQNTAISKLVYDFISGFHRKKEDGTTTLENGRLALFRNFDETTATRCRARTRCSSFSAAFSPDGSRIVTASWDKTARLWDGKTGAALATLKGHEHVVLSAAFSPDGSRIVTASVDKTARLWDGESGQALATLAGHEGSVLSAAFSPDGSRIVTASVDKTARLWDGKTGAALATLAGHEGSVASAAFRPDGGRIVTASADKTARLWDGKTGQALATLAGHEDAVLSAAFSPDGSRIVTASADKTARLWDGESGQALATRMARTWSVLLEAW